MLSSSGRVTIAVTLSMSANGWVVSAMAAKASTVGIAGAVVDGVAAAATEVATAPAVVGPGAPAVVAVAPAVVGVTVVVVVLARPAATSGLADGDFEAQPATPTSNPTAHHHVLRLTTPASCPACEASTTPALCTGIPHAGVDDFHKQNRARALDFAPENRESRRAFPFTHVARAHEG